MKTWYRSTSTKKLAGICGGISEMCDIDVTLVRFAFIILVLTPFPIIFSYCVAWCIVPKQGEINDNPDHITHNTTTPSAKPAYKPFSDPKRKKEFLVE